jgi:hypothetical protein
MLSIHWFAGIAIASTLSLMPDVAAAAEPRSLVPLDPAQGQLPESITTDAQGNIYLSMGNTIGVIDPDGELSTFATLPIPGGGFVTGLKFGPDGYLYAGTGAFFSSPRAPSCTASPGRLGDPQCAALPAEGFPTTSPSTRRVACTSPTPSSARSTRSTGCGGACRRVPR